MQAPAPWYARRWFRVAVAVAVVAAGVAFAALFRLPPHGLSLTGPATSYSRDLSATTAFVQPVRLGAGSVSSVEVLLGARGASKNTEPGLVRLYSEGDDLLAEAVVAAGAVGRSTPVTVTLPQSVSIGADEWLYVVLTSEGSAGAGALQAWLSDDVAAGSLVKVPAEALDETAPSQLAAGGEQQPVALSLRGTGLGSAALVAEGACRGAGLVASLLAAATVLWWGWVRRHAVAFAAFVAALARRSWRRLLDSAVWRPGAWLTEDHLIRFDRKTLAVCGAVAVLFVVLVAAGVHYSSVEMWNTVLPPDAADGEASALVWGHAKRVRSDEWMASTPALLNTYRQPGGPSDARVALDVVSPWNWGFYALGLERGFSFLWNFWYLGAFLSFFLLMMLLTKNDFVVSILSSFVVLLSSYNRWWDITVFITTFSVACGALLYFLQARKLGNIIGGFVLLCLFGLGFAVAGFYPAWQVPLVYLGLFVVVGYLLGPGTRAHLRVHLRTRAALAAAGVAGALAAAVAGYRVNAETLRGMMDTVYPGRRLSSGGDAGSWWLFSGFLDPLFSEKRFFWDNICESAGFVLLFPVVIGRVVVDRVTGRVKKVSPLLIAVAAYLVILLVYILVGVGGVLARATLLSYVTGHRAMIGLGLAGVVLTGLYLAERGRPAVRLRWVLLAGAVALAAFALFAYGFGRAYASPDWQLDWAWALPVVAALAVCAAALVARARLVYFVAVLALVAVPTYGVIPISTGLAPIYDKGLARAVEGIVAGDPDARWLVYGDYSTPNLVRAAGADVFNGVRFPPETGTMRKLDPEGKNEWAWNRYAHITAVPTSSPVVSFGPVVTDGYVLTVDPANEALAEAGVRYFVARRADERFFPPGEFKRLTSDPLNGYDIYERIGAAQ